MTLRASDRDRDATVELLAQAASDGQLTLEEYSERVDVALAAKMQDELSAVIKDLQQARGTLAPTAAAGGAAAAPLAASAAASTPAPTVPHTMSAILSSQQRKGRWKVPEYLRVRTVLGECQLELQSAQLTSHHTVIEADVLLGSVCIYVPEGVQVVMGGSAILADTNSQMPDAVAEGAPVIEVRGKNVLGSVTVRPPLVRHQLREALREEAASRFGRGQR